MPLISSDSASVQGLSEPKSFQEAGTEPAAAKRVPEGKKGIKSNSLVSNEISNWSPGTKSETDLGRCKWGRSGLFSALVSLNVHQRPQGNLASVDGHKAAHVAKVPQQGLGVALQGPGGPLDSSTVPSSCLSPATPCRQHTIHLQPLRLKLPTTSVSFLTLCTCVL